MSIIKKIKTLVGLFILSLRFSTPFSVFKTLREKRFTVNNLTFLGKKLYYTDQAAFLKTAEEIFIQEIYKFTSEKNNPLIVDCGANIGLSIIYYKKRFPNAQVIGFEPDSKTFEVLQKNLANFDLADVELRKEAVWTYDGNISFVEEGSESSHIEENNTSATSVKCIRLRHFLEKFEIIDFLKIDIEGAEMEVVQDIAEVLPLCRFVFVEYHSFASTPQQLPQLLQVLSTAGFRYKIQEAYAYQTPFMYTENHVNGMDLQLNIFAIRPPKA